MLSLPIPIIAGNFEDFHRMQLSKTKAEKAKKKLTEAKAKEEEDREAFCRQHQHLPRPEAPTDHSTTR